MGIWFIFFGGGLVRRGIPKEIIYKQITFISKKESIIEEVKRYIDSARA